MNTEKKLLFVYNADSGLFNTMADIGHKIFSPETYECDLCALTHGYFQERKDWKAFIETLNIPVEFLHRDEFKGRYQDNTDSLPAVFKIENKELEVCLTADAIRSCADIAELEKKLKQQCIS